MSNGLKWVKGGDSPNAAGRPPGSKRNYMRTLKRFVERNGSLKDLERIYNHRNGEKDQLEMLRSVWFYTLPRPQADSISAEEMEELYKKQISLEQLNKQLQAEIKRLTNVEAI